MSPSLNPVTLMLGAMLSNMRSRLTATLRLPAMSRTWSEKLVVPCAVSVPDSGLGQPPPKLGSISEVASVHVQAKGTPLGVFHQPLLPSGLSGVKASVNVGATVSILTVAVLLEPEAAPLLLGLAPSVAVQVMLCVPSPETLSV